MFYPQLVKPRRYRGWLPGGTPRIDWSNPLTAGLFYAIAPGAGLFDLTGNAQPLTKGSGAVIGMTAEGLGLSATATSSLTTGVKPTSIQPTQVTLFWRGNVIGASSGVSRPFFIGSSYSSADLSPNTLWTLGHDTSNAFTTGCSGAATVVTTAGTNGMHSLCSTLDTVANSGTLYVDAVSKGTGGTVTFNYAGSGPRYMLGGRVGGTTASYVNATANAAFIWSRILSTAEILSLHLDPYQFLIFGEDIVAAQLGLSAALPANQMDWPLPRGSFYSYDLRTGAQKFAATLVGRDVLPKSNFDQPLTKTRRYTEDLRFQTGSPAPHLVGKDSLPAFERDWPLPKAGRYTEDLRTATASPALTGRDTLPANKTDWSLPLSRLYPPDLRVPSSSANQNLYTVVAVQAPFYRLDWPLPRFQPFSADLRTAAQSPSLSGQDTLPFGGGDWPLPKARRYTEDLRTWIMVPSLRGQDSLPFSLIDQPLAKSRPYPIDLRTIIFAPSLAGQDALPFVALDQTLPRARFYSADLRAPSAPANPNLYTVVALSPFAETDWPLPLGKAYPADLRNWALAFNANLPGADRLPSMGRDWPVPRGAVYPLGLRTAIFAPSLADRDALPFGESDWPVPRGVIYPIGLRTVILAPSLVGRDDLPFAESEWPLPKTREYARELRSAFQAPALAGRDALPFAESDWPLPKTREYARELRMAFQGPPLAGRDALPFNLRDQSPVRIAIYPGELRAWLPAANPNLYSVIVAQAPFHQVDWPLPRARLYQLDLRTGVTRPVSGLIGQGVLPFVQLDWPVPKSRRDAHNLRAWVHLREWSLGFKPLYYTTTYGPPPPGPGGGGPPPVIGPSGTILMPIGYSPAPLGPATNTPASATWVRRIVDVVNNSLQGKLNATLPVTLAAGVSSTTILDARISGFSTLLLSPATPHAAAMQGQVYVSGLADGQATLTHNVTPYTDCNFMMAILG